MNKIKHCFIVFYRLVSISSIIFVVWKVRRHWLASCKMSTGHTIGALDGDAAERLENVATAIEKKAGIRLRKNLEKELDDVLTDTKKTVRKMTNVLLNGN